MDSLIGKLALVTGAAGVVGLAVSEALIEDGLRVVMVDLDAERLAVLAGGLGANVGQAFLAWLANFFLVNNAHS